jgi:hypothetical protein
MPLCWHCGALGLLERQSMQVESWMQAVISEQQLAPRQLLHESSGVLAPLLQIGARHSFWQPFWEQLSRFARPPCPPGNFWLHDWMQASSLHWLRHARRLPQGVPGAHWLSASQQFVSAQLWQLGSGLTTEPPQLVVQVAVDHVVVVVVHHVVVVVVPDAVQVHDVVVVLVPVVPPEPSSGVSTTTLPPQAASMARSEAAGSQARR